MSLRSAHSPARLEIADQDGAGLDAGLPDPVLRCEVRLTGDHLWIVEFKSASLRAGLSIETP